MKKTLFMLLTLFLAVAVFSLSGSTIELARAAVKFDPKKVNAKIDAGHLDKVHPLNPQIGGGIYLAGWARDIKQQKPALELVVLSDGKIIPITMKTGAKRDDVAKVFNNNNLTNAGFQTTFPAKIIGKGKHKLEIYVYQSDGSFVPLRYKDKSFVEVVVQ